MSASIRTSLSTFSTSQRVASNSVSPYVFDAPGELPPVVSHYWHSDTFEHSIDTHSAGRRRYR
jgi:hypothetical protein